MKAQKYMAKWAEKHKEDWLSYRQMRNKGWKDLAENLRLRLLAEEETVRYLGFTIKGNPDKGYELGCKWDEIKEEA